MSTIISVTPGPRPPGDLIRACREAQGLSGPELARRAGLTKPAIWLIEHGHHVPRIDTLFRIAQALRVEMAELIDEEWLRANRTNEQPPE